MIRLRTLIFPFRVFSHLSTTPYILIRLAMSPPHSLLIYLPSNLLDRQHHCCDNISHIHWLYHQPTLLHKHPHQHELISLSHMPCHIPTLLHTQISPARLTFPIRAFVHLSTNQYKWLQIRVLRVHIFLIWILSVIESLFLQIFDQII